MTEGQKSTLCYLHHESKCPRCPGYNQGTHFGDAACGEQFEDGPGFWFPCCAPKGHYGRHYRLPMMSEA